MITEIKLSPATLCDYCGRENPDRLSSCPGCGTLLVELPPPPKAEPKPKSKLIAVCLALICPPLGLFYARKRGPALLILLIGALIVFTRTSSLWLVFASRIICAIWAYYAVAEPEDAPNTRRDSLRLLQAAARLENKDRLQAIAAYENIIRLYPNTPASGEAQRNIETLKQNL